MLKLRTLLDLTPAETTDQPPQDQAAAVITALALELKHRLTGGGTWGNGVKIAEALENVLASEPEEATFAARVYMRHLGLRAPSVQVTALHVGVVRYLCGVNPAKAVMWAHATAALAARTGENQPTAISLFGSSMDQRLPTDVGYKAAWQEQKIPLETLRKMRAENPGCMDNYLDHPMAWTKECLLSGAKEAAQ